MHENDIVMYDDDDLLQLSGIQHFSFCPRQWALIHIEGQWQENLRTIEGAILHERAHDDAFTQKRGDLLISRGMPVVSYMLGVSGQCDIVEFRRDDGGVPIHGRDGQYLPMPVEYKRGAPKASDADRLQLCLQAMCLEEMLVCTIEQACLYYGETRRRERVELTQELRGEVRQMLSQMHAYYERRHTPRVKPTKSCNACSLKTCCLPRLGKGRSADGYIHARLWEEDTPCGS